MRFIFYPIIVYFQLGFIMKVLLSAFYYMSLEACMYTFLLPRSGIAGSWAIYANHSRYCQSFKVVITIYTLLINVWGIQLLQQYFALLAFPLIFWVFFFICISAKIHIFMCPLYICIWPACSSLLLIFLRTALFLLFVVVLPILWIQVLC